MGSSRFERAECPVTRRQNRAEPSKLAVRGPSPVWLRGATSQDVVLMKKHLSTEGALGRSAAVSSRNRRLPISASFSGVGLWESDLSSRRNAGDATGASEARPMANEAEEENASTFER